MESLEQYRVIDNYHRKDAHQVSLHAGQIVHVIEKHDTGQYKLLGYKYRFMCMCLNGGVYCTTIHVIVART